MLLVLNVIVFLSLLAVSTSGVVEVLPRSGRQVTVSNNYAVIIDAGSSGTRVWTYQWPDIETGQTLPILTAIDNFEKKPGLSNFADNRMMMESVLKELIQRAKDRIPQGQYSATPIYLMATAGMRLLLEDKAYTVFEELDEILRDPMTNPFEYNSRHNARILSGEEEGVFAWIAVNYLNGVFNGNGENRTSGILELGGASTQIAFIPRGSILADKFPVQIAGQKYSIYVHSYLHYGQDYVDMWVKDHLQEKQETRSSLIENPCLLKGENSTSDSVTFVGTGKPAECANQLMALVHKSRPRWCHPKPCAIGTVYQPTIPADKTFYATSAFVKVLQDLAVIEDDRSFSLTKVYEKATAFCQKNFTDIQERTRSDKLKYASKPCIMGLYTSILFAHGYGFANDTRKILAIDWIGRKQPDWTMGAILYEMENARGSCNEGGKTLPDTSSSSSSISNRWFHPSSSFLSLVALVFYNRCLPVSYFAIVV